MNPPGVRIHRRYSGTCWRTRSIVGQLEESSPLVVLGMHRSGTSLVARWLNECGLFLGDELYGASEFNPHGYFEDVDFIRLHQALLEEQGLHPSGHEQPVCRNTPLSGADLDTLETFLRSKSKPEPWGWKDPRTCLFLDGYRSVCPNARYLVVVRHYAPVVASLVRREVAYRSRIHQRLKSLGITFTEKLLQRRHGNDYLEIVDYYYSRLLEHCEDPATECTVLLVEEFADKGRLLFDTVSGFVGGLEYVAADKVIDTALLSHGGEASFLRRDLVEKVGSSYEALRKLAI